MKLSAISVILAALLSYASALHIYLGGDSNQKCFYQDLPKGSVLAGEFR
jgi:hypothetical protein